MQKETIWLIGGGETFVSQQKYHEWLQHSDFLERLSSSQKQGDWKKWLSDGLFDTHTCIKIPMIDKTNADYEAWKIIFEHFCDNMDTNAPISLIWHSLGGIFLAKYLSENKFPVKIKALHLVAPTWTHPQSEIHNTASFSFHPMKLSKIPPQCKKIYIWASEDDEIVDFADAEKYSECLPMADFRVFKNRWHFIGSHFVELFETFL